MPDARLRRTRATLPEGYQYGDAVRPGVRSFLSALVLEKLALGLWPRWYGDPIVMCSCEDWTTCEHPWPQSFQPGWRAPHENAAAQLKRQAALNTEVTSLVAAHVHGDAIARDYFDAFESQRTGEETL